MSNGIPYIGDRAWCMFWNTKTGETRMLGCNCREPEKERIVTVVKNGKTIKRCTKCGCEVEER